MKLPEKVTRLAGKGWLKVRKRSPELLFGLGVLSMGGAIVSAVKAARRHDQIIAEHETNLEEAKMEYIIPDEYDIVSMEEGSDEYKMEGSLVKKTEKQINRDVRKVYTHTAKELVKLYSKTGLFVSFSLFCFGGSYKVLSGRVTAGLLTIDRLKNYISLYEQRNIELNGEESHQMCKYGYKEVTVTEGDGKNKKEVKKLVPDYSESEVDGEFVSMPSVMDPTTLIFCKDTSNEYKGVGNLDWLTVEAAEQDAVRVWRTKGWVCENDVRTYLGMEKTVEGQFRCKFYHDGPDHGEEPSFNLYSPANQNVRDGHNKCPIYLELNFTDNLLAADLDEKKRKDELMASLRAQRLSEEV